MDFGRSERLVRINPFYTQRAEHDLAAVLPGKPDAIVVPKANTAEIIKETDRLISAAESELGFEKGSIGIIALIESGIAYINLASICAASPRVQGLILGAEDLCADTRYHPHTPVHKSCYLPRSSLVMHAAAFGLQAIDIVQNQLHQQRLVASRM